MLNCLARFGGMQIEQCSSKSVSKIPFGNDPTLYTKVRSLPLKQIKTFYLNQIKY